MPPPDEYSISAIFRWITAQTLAVLALVIPTTWFAANYAYIHLGIVAANDPSRTALFIVGLATVETILFCPVMIIPISTMMSKLETARAELEKLAATDSLTGLLNRRGFEAAVARRRLAISPNAACAALACDIDWFKRANDQYGHDFGDSALHALGALIAEATKPCEGIAARFGGEEFIIFVTGRPTHEVMILAETLRVGFQNRSVEFEGVSAYFTISIGVAFAEGSAEIARLIAQADNALYEAKRAGRNRVTTIGKTSRQHAA
jgi:diguanylate cyclase (GGDEF)-like protein